MPEPGAPGPLEIGALVALVHAERLCEAEHRARELIKNYPRAGMLWKILGVALVRQGKDALQALERTTELLPADGEGHRNLGAALYDRGQWALALSSLHRALAIQPKDLPTLVDAANTLRKLGRPAEAAPLYLRVLQLEPREVEAQNNLGNVYLELHQYHEAEHWYRRALASKPADAQILCNLGYAQRALGQLEHSLSSFRRALERDPACVDALNGLGNALRDRAEHQLAADQFRLAIELEPSRAESHAHLGAVLFEMHRVAEAMASFAQALILRPDHAPAHLGLALALRQQRRPDEAEVRCSAALAAHPDYPEALCLLGELRADRGRFAEAQELFERAIRIAPDFAPAYAGIATHRRMNAADTSWLRGASALTARGLPLAQDIGLHYALGKYFDDLGQYDQAFDHYRQANESSKRLGTPYEPARLTRRVAQIMESFDATSMQRISPTPGDSELPVFIIGMPRSGTSLAEQILASHPAVFGAGEVLYWNGAYEAYRQVALEQRDVVALIPGMAREYLQRLQSLGGQAQRVIDKMPANFWYAGLLHAAFPRARIIHMQRHPIDTCLSIYFQNFFNIGSYAHDLTDLAHFYGEYLHIMAHWRRTLPETTLLEVPYEGLVEEPEVWARRMLTFVGLPWDPRCLDFYRTERVVITASKWQVRQKISSASVGRWRHYEKHIGPLRALAQLLPPGTAAPPKEAPPAAG
jgi:tetratricopeptide (TPR) repeat protein